MISHPQALVERARAEYPDHESVQRFVLVDSSVARENLCEVFNEDLEETFDPDEVLRLLDAGDLDELRNRAQRLSRVKAILDEWPE